MISIKAISFGRRLVGATLVGGAILLISVVLLLQSSLNMVAKQANALDDRRSEEALKAAIDLSRQHLASVVELNSVWDDAVTHVYAKTLDTDWLYASYGALAKDDSDYDGVYVVDATGRILWGNAYQKGVTETNIEQVAGGLKRQLSNYSSVVPPQPVSDIFGSGHGPVFAGIGLIQPSSAKVSLPKKNRLFLVLTRHLNATVFATYARSYSVGNLRLDSHTHNISAPHLRLASPTGLELGVLAWDARKPGQAAAKVVAPKIIFSVVLVALLMIVLVGMVVLGLRRLAVSEARAQLAARTDALTGLPNRGSFMRTLRAMEKCDVALAFLDLDDFKHLNDTYGNKAGDQILVVLAERFQLMSGESCQIARIGGDQFGFLVWGEDVENRMREQLRTVRLSLEAPFELGAGHTTMSATIGIACNRSGKVEAEELCRRANAALNGAKIHARGKNLRYDSIMDAEIQLSQTIEREIREGLERNEFEVFYQPIVSAADNTINSVEALVRWPRRPGGSLGPDAFIEIAERAGLIHQLGLFVLRRACEDMCASSAIRLSVNVSPAQFHDPSFLPNVRNILTETRFPADRLELEITEGYLIDLPEQAQIAIAELRRLGISIVLDDFGVGYSSIGYLRRYAFDKLKIDKSLAGTVAIDAQSGALVVATVAIARALNIPVTAEGVETLEQASLLHLAGCKNLQGYLFGKPQSISDLLECMCKPAIKSIG